MITGHTGFKGSWLCQILLDMGAKVSGFALEPNTEPNLYSILGLDKQVSSHIADIREYDKFCAVLEAEAPDILIHLAAQPLVRASYDEPLYTFDTNVMGTANVLEAVRHAPSVRSAVMITTDKVYENPEAKRPFKESDPLGGHDPYSASKAAAEIVISSYSRSFFHSSDSPLVASARAGNVIGGGDWSADRIVPDIIRAKAAGRQLVLRNPGSIRPWQHVLDPLYGYLLLAKGLHEGKRELAGAYNFAPGEKEPLTVEQIAKKSGVKYSVQPEPAKHEAGMLRLDAAKAKKALGWKSALPIGDSLSWTFDWYAQHAAGRDMAAFTKRQISDYLKKAES